MPPTLSRQGANGTVISSGRNIAVTTGFTFKAGDLLIASVVLTPSAAGAISISDNGSNPVLGWFDMSTNLFNGSDTQLAYSNWRVATSTDASVGASFTVTYNYSGNTVASSQAMISVYTGWIGTPTLDGNYGTGGIISSTGSNNTTETQSWGSLVQPMGLAGAWDLVISQGSWHAGTGAISIVYNNGTSFQKTPSSVELVPGPRFLHSWLFTGIDAYYETAGSSGQNTFKVSWQTTLNWGFNVVGFYDPTLRNKTLKGAGI